MRAKAEKPEPRRVSSHGSWWLHAKHSMPQRVQMHKLSGVAVSAAGSNEPWPVS